MTTSYLTSVTKQFEYYKMLGEKAMGQLPDEALFWQFNEASNSISVLVSHIAGNMLSRFTDFLRTDGEKPWRNRDAEFEERFSTREEVLNYWNQGWTCLLQTVESLKEEDLETIIYIRNEGHTVVEALNRQLAHYPYHFGQIVFIAKMAMDEEWESLSIPKNKSQDYNSRKFAQERTRRHFTDDV
jgi:hypothetical protein